MKRLKLAASGTQDSARPMITFGPLTLGKDLAIVAVPCEMGDEDQAIQASLKLRDAGAHILKWESGKDDRQILAKVKRVTGLAVMTEIMDTREIPVAAEFADILMVGSAHMQNFALLKELGRSEKPVLLQRGRHATLNEWLNSAEYILSGGNRKVLLCEAGIRTFEAATRIPLDLSSVPAVKLLSHLPILVDPSASGRAGDVERLCLAAIAAGADGLMVEVYPWKDVPQGAGRRGISLEIFSGLVAKMKKMASLMEEVLALPSEEKRE